MIRSKGSTAIIGCLGVSSKNTIMIGGLISNPVIVKQHDFVASPVLPSFLTLSRLSAATYFNNQGVLSDAAADTARFDYGYDGTNWVNQGLLVEKQSTNYFYDSISPANRPVQNSNTSKTSIFNPLSGLNTGVRLGRTSGASFALIRTDRSPITTVSLSWTIYFNFGAHSLHARDDTLKTNSDTNVGYSTLRTPTYFSYAQGSGGFNIKEFKYQDLSNYKKSQVTIDNFKSVNGGTQYVGCDQGTTISSNLIDIFAVQYEVSTYPTSIIVTAGAAVTRTPDNLQLNVTNYTGSIKLTYKRQDTEAVESTWLDLTNAINPIISNNLAVGIWLQNIAVYNRILTAQEKSNV